MVFFKKKRKAKNLYLAKTEIISSYDNSNGFGPMCVTQYFLAEKRNKKYYELYSGEELELEENTKEPGFCFKTTDVPYITEIGHISRYSDKKEFTDSELFDFITRTNTYNTIDLLTENDEDEDFEEEMS